MKLIIKDDINNAKECIFERSKERLKNRYEKCKSQSIWSRLNINNETYAIYWITTTCLIAISYFIGCMVKLEYDLKFSNLIIPAGTMIIWHLIVLGYLISKYIEHDRLLRAIKSERDFMNFNTLESYVLYAFSNPKHKYLAKYFINQMNILDDIQSLQRATQILDAEIVDGKLIVNYTNEDCIVRTKTISKYDVQYLTNIDVSELVYENANVVYKVPYNYSKYMDVENGVQIKLL